MNDLGTMLRRRYRYTWFIFGCAFLLLCYEWPKEGETPNIGPPLGLILIYVVSSQLVPTICANRIRGYVYEPQMAFFTVTIKVGALASIGSVLLHMGIFASSFGTWHWHGNFSHNRSHVNRRCYLPIHGMLIGRRYLRTLIWALSFYNQTLGA
jgi:uncharacterized membrane protein YidH (DUF202 family)